MGARFVRRATPILLLLAFVACEQTNAPPPVHTAAAHDFDQLAPAVHGDTVVWEDYRSAQDGDGSDIYRRDIPNGTEVLVNGGKWDQDQPAISDQYIVWADRDRIYAQARQGSTARITVAQGSGDRYAPAVCGSVVVWVDTRNGSTDIYGRNLAGGGEFPVAVNAATNAWPACDGNRVVYMRSTTQTGADIYAYNIATQQTSIVAAEFWNEWRPAISGDLVVWQWWPNQPNGNIQIRGRNLATGQFFDVATGQGNKTAPAISGTIVVWEDASGQHANLRWRDTANGSNPAWVRAASGDQRVPAISGRRVAWQTDSTGPWTVQTVVLP